MDLEFQRLIDPKSFEWNPLVSSKDAGAKEPNNGESAFRMDGAIEYVISS
jgi:hypothetical protein